MRRGIDLHLNTPLPPMKGDQLEKQTNHQQTKPNKTSSGTDMKILHGEWQLFISRECA